MDSAATPFDREECRCLADTRLRDLCNGNHVSLSMANKYRQQFQALSSSHAIFRCVTDLPPITEVFNPPDTTPAYSTAPDVQTAVARIVRSSQPASLNGGVGTELKNLLKFFGQYDDVGCNCKKHAETMDRNGIAWCEQNIPAIVGWLQEEAARRKALKWISGRITGMIATRVVQRAIANAKKKEAPLQQMAVATIRSRPAKPPMAQGTPLHGYPCIHRGVSVLRTENGHGRSLPVYHCAKFQTECTVERVAREQQPLVCSLCQSRETPTTLGPPFPQQRGPSPFAYQSSKTSPEFVTLETFVADTRRLAAMIPEGTSRIIGVSRSGVTPANIIATILHLPMSYVRQSTGDLIDGGNGWRLTGNTGGRGPAVVIDDTVMSGNSLKHVMPIVWKEHPQAISAAVYVNPAARQKPDIWVRDLPWPHLLEWNLPNSIMTTSCAFDMDGILCHDCGPGDDDDGPRYQAFLRDAILKYPVRRVQIPMIATGRLEKYRSQTLEWLGKHGMSTRSLKMFPGTFHQRNTTTAAEFKARCFREFLATNQHRIKPAIFVESDEAQARIIAGLTKSLVVCPPAGRCFS